MKVSPLQTQQLLSPPTCATEFQEEGEEEEEDASDCGPRDNADDYDDGGGDDDDDDDRDRCSKRRRLHSQTDFDVNRGNYLPQHHHRRNRHLGGRRRDDNHLEDKSSSMDCYDDGTRHEDAVGDGCNSICGGGSSNSGGGVSDCDDSSTNIRPPPPPPPPLLPPPTSQQQQQQQQHGGPLKLLSSACHNNKKDDYQQSTIVNNNNCNNEGDCMAPAIRNAVQQLTTNNDGNISLALATHSEKNNDNETNKIKREKIIPPRPVEHSTRNETFCEKIPSVVNADFNDPINSVNDCMNSEISNDDCLSQSPLNLTRSQGSSEESGNKSEEDDEGEYDDDSAGKNSISNVTNEDESIVNGHNLPSAGSLFPWNITMGSNKQKQQHHDDKVAATPPQLLLTSGQLTTGCLQAAQLLIPTARGIMTQTILAIPINDMVSSAVTASTTNQQQLQQQLLYHSSNNVRQKNMNRQQLNQTCQSPLSLPLNHYFQQHQTTADDTANIAGGTENINNDNNNYDTSMINSNTATAADQYNNIQRRKWHPTDISSKKQNFLSHQQKLLVNRSKNGGNGGESTNNGQRTQEPSAVPQATATNGADCCSVYAPNSAVATAMPMSPPAAVRRAGGNGTGVDAAAVQRHPVAWPGAAVTADRHDGGDENDDEGKLFPDDKQPPQHQPSRHAITSTPPASSKNININLKSLAPPSSQLNCHVKQSKDEETASAAAAAAAAYNQQNAICTALATHMLCASQLAAAQQPMFDNLDNSNAVKKPSHMYNNNNNNLKTNNMMGVVNPAVLEKWMMEERYYYNNNNNNSKNIAGGHSHHQRYNAAAAAAAAAAVELLSGGVSASSSGGGGDSLASCKKRKRRTSFTPHALELLNGHFERNTHPSGSEITGLAHRLGYEREVIRIWFCNKRQALKNTVRTINGNGPTNVHMTGTKSHNTGGY